MRPRELASRTLVRLERLVAACDGRSIDADALRSVPSWGLSVLLHAFAVLLLALLLRGQGAVVSPERSFAAELAPAEIADLTSLVEADRAGDPFTDLDDPNPPSLGLESAEPMLRLTNQPEFPGLSAFAPDVAGPRPDLDLGRSPLEAVSLPNSAMVVQAPFSGRSGPSRAELVRLEGGTVESENAVEAGLDWIVRHQAADGSWVLDVHQVCQTCPSQGTIDSRTGATGLALLPLLGAGHIHTVKSRHQAAVRRGLEWLTANQQPNGDLYVGGSRTSYLYSHAIAAMALCEAYGLSRDPALREPARRAIAFIADAQDMRSGGWRYAPGQFGDTSVFGWNVFALRSADLAGLKVPKQTLRGCNAYLNLAATDGKRVLYAYQPNQAPSAVMTAEALVGRQILGWGRNHPSLVKGAGRVAANLESSEERNIYYWYYATQLLHNMRNKDWERWNPRVREVLVGTQSHEDGCAAGSWDPSFPSQDRWGAAGGRLFQTSLSILTLEVYYRYLPLYRTADEKGMDAPPATEGDASDAKTED